MITINATNIYTLGLLPSPTNPNIYPITGLLDLPKRKGIISHDWGTVIEPFLSAQDIEFEGRNLMLSAIIKESSNANLLTRLSALKTTLINNVLTLVTDISTHTVYFVDAMKTKRLDDTFVSIEIPFFEPFPVIPTVTGSATGGTGFTIGGFNLKNDFGISITEISENMNIPKRIDVGTTDFYKFTGYREKETIQIDGILEGADLAGIKTNADKFIALMASPGSHVFAYINGNATLTYCADGVQFKEIYPKLATFSLILRKA
jgi:hypothetical protein